MGSINYEMFISYSVNKRNYLDKYHEHVQFSDSSTQSIILVICYFNTYA